MRVHALLAVAALVVAPSMAVAQTSAALDAQVQAPELGAPQRASVAGQLASTAFGPADLARGAFSLPAPMTAPQERGPLLASPFPTYSPDAGVTEWGLGWRSELVIRRSRLVGSIDYATDDLTAPFGRLVKGADGYWYPAGLSKTIRVAWSGGDTITAYLPDGTRQTYGGAATVQNASGVYAWALTEVVTVTGRRTSLSWSANASGQLFLASVRYGGVGADYQHQIDFAYEAVPLPFTDYRSRYPLSLDRRVKAVTVLTRSAATGAFEERWRYELAYTDEGLGPASFLASVQQVFRSGERPPPTTYTYHLARPRLESAALAPSPKVNSLLLAFASTGALQPNKSAQVDANLDGLVDVENARDYQLARQTDTGFVFEALPPMPADVNIRCRKTVSSANTPRVLSPFAGDDTNYVVDLYATSSQTTLTVCNRLGLMQGTQKLTGNWQPSATVKLVDLNQDHKPDVIRVQTGSYLILPNVSGGGTFGFGAMTQGTLRPSFTPDSAWVQDLNGDAIPDIVVRNSSSLTVWYGKGSYLFETQGVTYPIKTALGYISKLSDYSLTFLDANKDGLADLVMTKTVGNVALLMVNRGDRFEEVVVPGFRAVNSNYSAPVVADLDGSGNAEVTYTKGWDGVAVTLDGPETGLMSSADDGKGTVLRFAYERALPSPGARSRQAVLSSLTVQSFGVADVTYQYAYQAPVAHTQGKFLVGYGRVDRWYGDVSGVPLGATWAKFLNGDDHSALPDETGTQDAFAPGLERFAKTTYEPQDPVFQGIRWKRVSSQESGWRSVDPTDPDPPVVSETTYVRGYFAEFCPSSIEKVTASGTLLEAKGYASLAAFAQSLSCITRDITASSEAPYRFSYRTVIDHNDAGQVTQVASVADGDTWVLQDVAYDAQWRVRSVSAPGRGTTTATYDAETGLLESITTPTGMIVAAVARDPLTGGVTQLRSDRGGLVYDQFFRFDGQERLALGWDSIGAGTSLDPDFTFSYRYATAMTPGAITSSVLVDAGAMSVRTSVDLFTAGGATLGSATQIPEGWAMGNVTYRDPSAGRSTTYAQATFGPGLDPGQLTLPEIFAGAGWIANREAGEFGVGFTTTRLHADVQQQIGEALGIDPERALLVRSSTENERFASTVASDASGNRLGYWNEVGTTWGYVYDALGRLREIQLPDGTRHRVEFDAHGRASRITREGVATIDYLYEPVTGLLREKRFTGNTGALRRKELYAYDAIGRISVKTHLDVATGETLGFGYFYDGATASSPSDRGQLGLLTGVSGRGFEKRLSYRDDGKLASRTLTLAGGWRKVLTTIDYDENGNEKQESTVVRDARGAVVASSSTAHGYDAYGRTATTSLGGSPLAAYTYDADGLLQQVALAGGNSLTLTHDGLTRALTGTSQRSAGTVASVDRRFNDRGLVERDDIVVGALSLRRAYAYSDERFLTDSADARATSSYAYSRSGLPTSITENLVPVQIPTQKDDLGRTVVRSDLAMAYGPDGQLASATRGLTTWTFLYDEDGQRLLKYRDGVPVAAYPEEGFLDESGLTQPLKLAGRTVGVLVNGVYEPRSTDLLGTPIADLDGAPRIASPYGSRWLDGHPARSAALDYVEKGFDQDLGLVRMGVRDYDPELAVFVTPDPLFLEEIGKVQDSPYDGSLYAYARLLPNQVADPTGLFGGGEMPMVPDGEGIPFSVPGTTLPQTGPAKATPPAPATATPPVPATAAPPGVGTGRAIPAVPAPGQRGAAAGPETQSRAQQVSKVGLATQARIDGERIRAGAALAQKYYRKEPVHGDVRIYRSMKLGDDGGFIASPVSGAPNGNQKGARTLGSAFKPQDADFKVWDASSMVGPDFTGTQNLSANLKPGQGRNVDGWITVQELPLGLVAVNDHDDHVAIIPVENMSFADAQILFNSIAWRKPGER